MQRPKLMPKRRTCNTPTVGHCAEWRQADRRIRAEKERVRIRSRGRLRYMMIRLAAETAAPPGSQPGRLWHVEDKREAGL